MKSIGLFMLTTCLAGAQTNDVHFDVLRTLDGQCFTNATITRTTAVFAVVDFDGGGKRIAFTNLSPEIRRQFSFDQIKADAEIALAEQKKKAADKASQDAAKAADEARKDQLFRFVESELVPVTAGEFKKGKIGQVLTNGILLNPGGVAMYPGGFYWVSDGTTIFVECPTHGLSDGQVWDGWCYKVGTYRYETINDSVATVKRFETGLSYSTKSDAVLTEIPALLRPRPRFREQRGTTMPY